MVRRKKSEVAGTAPAIQMHAQSAPSVALLIDGENVTDAEKIAYILAEAGKMGGVTVRQVYGNWASSSMQPWKDMPASYALKRMNSASPGAGRNATDIALVIGAMDLLYLGFKHFCLVTGDSDYLPLVHRLRQDGCTVLGIGMPNASQALKDACNTFIPIDQLIPQKGTPASGSLNGQPAKNVEKKLLDLLITACTQLKKDREDEWIPLTALGKTLKDSTPDFQATYGKKKLSEFIKQYPDNFEICLREKGKGETIKVRLLKQKPG